MIKPLKLRAQDAEDIQVISAVLQDAIVPVVDMGFIAAEKNFVMVVQRLCRDEDEMKERVCCAFNLRGVEKVQSQGFDPVNGDLLLDLLAVMPEPDGLELVFADSARIRLQARDWSLIVEDFGERWPAKCNPCHEDGAASA